ncbi:YcaO-related McrA-glycine thioamidation protein [Methanococcoides orientis]|uniref:YcaO-related McrA-glycine thioamidation protein n=1 Tax=Methanococcoides orientis TaxID=2822137 RepID=UPI001E4427F6|nr:YcaO-related McrA-glycine thioamidation protein [Methanococcoides orientis]UGV40649.1 YcaO-related McrA-glycine thioamidation protein [Methanococcoides orientis]
MSHIPIDRSLQYMDGTQRVFDEETTLGNTKPHLEEIGVTRIASITDLDRIGIPVFSAIRPSAAEGAISIYSGKGASETQARISAMMESFERCLAERVGVNADIVEDVLAEEFIESVENAAKECELLDPHSLLLAEPLPPESLVEWTQAWDLLREKEVYVPSNAVYHPYDSPGMSARLFRSNTNGLASGNVIEEAILHGLLEVIERDALSIAEFNRNPGREIVLTEEDGINYELMKKFESNGVQLKLWLLSHDTGITSVVAATDDLDLKDPALLVMGAGSHLKPEIAIRRAITEAAQSRVVQIHGAREDTDRESFVRQIGYERMKRMNNFWYEGADSVTTGQLTDISRSTPAENIDVVLDELRKITDSVIVVDLSRKKVGVPVVRVIIPGFEQYTLDRERVGHRVRQGRKRSTSGEKPWKRRFGKQK